MFENGQEVSWIEFENGYRYEINKTFDDDYRTGFELQRITVCIDYDDSLWFLLWRHDLPIRKIRGLNVEQVGLFYP